MRAARWMALLLVGCGGGDGEGRGGTVVSSSTAAAPTVTLGTSNQRLAIPLEVTLDGLGRVEVACTRDDVPEEVLVARSDLAQSVHGLLVQGGAAGATYQCAVQGPSGGVTTVSVTLPSLPEPFGVEVTVPAPAGTPPFLTLYADLLPCAESVGDADAHVVMVDHRGEARWWMEVPEPMPSIDLDVRLLEPEGWVHMAGGWGTGNEEIPHRGIFRTVDLTGEVQHERAEVGFGLGFNHHSERMDDGSFATLSFDLITDGVEEKRAPAIEWWDPTSGELTRTWTAQQLIDEGLRFDDLTDLGVWAANSFELADDPLGQGLYVSVVSADEVWRLDPTSGSLTHRIGAYSGWTLFDVDGSELGADGWFSFQHDPEVARDGRMLVHDNGGNRGLGPVESRVLELELDFARHEAQVVWEWTEPGWGNRFVGDADRLATGTVAITQGYFHCLSGSDGHSSVVEVDPATDEVVWRLDWTHPEAAPYRSERVDLCTWLPNARDCPEGSVR